MTDKAEFLRDTWYMAAWADEVGEALLSRTIAGIKLVLYRRQDGDAAALADRCPHRFAPLSIGTRRGDTIVCGYHGLSFGADGRCVANPFSDRIPAGASVRAFPVEERDGIVWLWFGDPAAADPAAIPDFTPLAETPVSRTLRGVMPMQANYEFGTDNLMDLSHIEFVHKGSFAGGGVIFAGQHEIRQEGGTLHSNWWMPKVKAPPHTAGVFPPDMITDHWLDMRWDAPASMYLQIGASPVGQPRDTGVIVHQAHILTPESGRTTHYFWASTFAAAPGVPDLEPMLRQLLGQAFEQEDKPMIEAAYHNLGGDDFWQQRPVSLGIDQGGTRARRMIEAKLRRERVPPPVARAG